MKINDKEQQSLVTILNKELKAEFLLECQQSLIIIYQKEQL